MNLAKLKKDFINSSFDFLEHSSDLLSAVNNSLRALDNYHLTAKGKSVREIRVEVPVESEAYKALYVGSACYLYVPNFIAAGKRVR